MSNSSKGWFNPALRAMGIPRIKLPSRNWMIFWTVATTTVSGIVYDKYQQKQIMKQHTALMKHKLNEPVKVNEMPRKITVFIAPPPSDYLDTSMKIWRRYIKPILFYAGLDYEIVSEEKQGVIRTYVANEMRQLRKNLIAAGQNGKTDQVDKIEHDRDLEANDEENDDSGLIFKKNFDYKKLIGIFYKNEHIIEKVEYDDAKVEDSKLSGGVICLGRGAYKEYLNGLQEGLLGPLIPSTTTSADHSKETTANQNGVSIVKDDALDDINIADTIDDDPFIKDEFEQAEAKRKSDSDDLNAPATQNNDGNEKDVESKVKEVKDENLQEPYIDLSKFEEANLPPEILSHLPIVRDPVTQIPIFLHQPVLMITVPNLIGFINIPARIARFYQRRYYCQSVCEQVTNLVNQGSIRKFNDPADLDLGSVEELDWPNYWIQQGKKKNSEWTRELHSNKEVTDWLWVYE